MVWHTGSRSTEGCGVAAAWLTRRMICRRSRSYYAIRPKLEVVAKERCGMEMRQGRSAVEKSTMLIGLVYELLDAHEDTARITRDQIGDERWAAHLDYLRQLQRVGREMLARMAV